MRDFGVLKGPDLVPVLATLMQEGALRDGSVMMLKAVHQDLRSYVELYYLNDYCIHAHASDYSFRLEQVLYRKRLLDRAQLEELQSLAKQSPGRSLSEFILEKQWISAPELAQVVSHLTELISYDVLLWKDTAFHLTASNRKPEEFFGAGLAPEKLMSVRFFVDDAEKNLPVLVLMREKLANPNSILRRLKEVDRAQLSDYQYHVYRYVNNRNSVRELLQVSDLGYFETFAALFQLLSWEHIGLGQLEVPHYARSEKPRTDKPDLREVRSAPAVSSAARPTAARAHSKAESASNASTEHSGITLPPANQGGQRQFLRRGRGSELLQILVAVMKSGYTDGRIIVDNQHQITRAEFSLLKGGLVHVSTTAFNIRFGDLLVRRGELGPGQLREALEEQKSSPDTHLGEILVRHDVVKESQIPALVTHQMEAVIYEVLSWADVKFYFDAQSESVQQDISHKVSVSAPFDILDGRLSRTDASDGRNLLEEADHNLPILLMMREKMPNLKAIPRQTGRASSVLADEQDVMLKMVDGRTSLQDLLLATMLPYFQAYVALFQLVSTGVLELLESPEARTTVTAPRPVRPVVSPPVRQSITSRPVQAQASSVAVAAPESEVSVMELLDSELLELISRVPAGRQAEIRQALKSVLKLVVQE